MNFCFSEIGSMETRICFFECYITAQGLPISAEYFTLSCIALVLFLSQLSLCTGFVSQRIATALNNDYIFRYSKTVTTCKEPFPNILFHFDVLLPQKC